jgi:CPA2 family monovalent cation:H+ antiporter-2
MEHASNLTGLAVVVLTALGCGMVMARFRQPAIVGYLVAGVLLGPGGFELVENRGQVSVLAELGVLLLLFVVGMELSVRSLRFTWRIAVPAVVLQTAASLAVMLLVAWGLGYPAGKAILLGFVIALSSTAVAVKMMEEIGALRSRVGRVTVAILIAQDLAFLPMLIVVERLGSAGFGWGAALQIALAVGLMVVLVRVLVRRRRVDLPFARIIVGHTDLSPLSGLVYCFGAGAALGLLGLSPAYGAFLAGLAIGNSTQREAMLAAIRPIQSVLVMVFFLSIGLLIDLDYIWSNVGTVLLLLLLVTLFKTTLNIAVLRFLKESWPRAFLGGLLISQVGEFSFLLAAAGLAVGAIGPNESRLVISVTVLSLSLSPFWLSAARRFQRIAATQLPTLQSVIEITYGDETARIGRAVRRSADCTRKLGRRTAAAMHGLRARIARRRAPPPEAASDRPDAAPPADTPPAQAAGGPPGAPTTIAEVGDQVRRAASGDATDDRRPTPRASGDA